MYTLYSFRMRSADGHVTRLHWYISLYIPRYISRYIPILFTAEGVRVYPGAFNVHNTVTRSSRQRRRRGQFSRSVVDIGTNNIYYRFFFFFFISSSANSIDFFISVYIYYITRTSRINIYYFVLLRCTYNVMYLYVLQVPTTFKTKFTNGLMGYDFIEISCLPDNLFNLKRYSRCHEKYQHF